MFSLESPTAKLHVNAPESIEVKGGAGQITASCLSGLNLQATQGKVSNSLFIIVFFTF